MLPTRLILPTRATQLQLSIRTPTPKQWPSGYPSNPASQRWSTSTNQPTKPPPAVHPTPKPLTPPHHPAPRPNEPSTNSNPTLPVLNIFTLLRDQSPAVRRGVLGFLAVLATLETSFWIKVIHSKFFAKEDDGFWEKYLEFLRGVRRVWMGNYQSWWFGGMWGL